VLLLWPLTVRFQIVNVFYKSASIPTMNHWLNRSLLTKIYHQIQFLVHLSYTLREILMCSVLACGTH
jgi:hypothetical protein